MKQQEISDIKKTLNNKPEWPDNRWRAEAV